ncbi:SMP-30/gluconolactonase/LRE family protein [Nocardioides rubriscoriae]|uniref:SMP-30/gluconolactonase/LRE family protein n=1 Tax=Nocardioides rubriscoriae TaxID=642762 RepID=UPI0011E05171|nr:SMP-30/gluconolactonase/LRE family protein [Nocardioides rubriscoriae]
MGLVLALALSVLAPSGTGSAVAGDPTFRTRVFSLVPAPGHPAYVHVGTNGRVYAGTYESGDAQPSRVLEWRADGTLLRSWTVPGQRLDGTQGVQVANQTRDGRLVLLETSTRALLTLDVRTGRFRRIATFPADAVPNYATWGPRHLFVTDYAHGVVYRVRPTGRVERWFASPALEGVAGFGTTGIVYREKQRDLLITQQTVADGSTVPTNGKLYSLPVRDGRPGTIRTLWTSRPTDLPDGFGIGRSGRIYVAMAGLTNQLVRLSPTGRELSRFPDAPLTGDNGSPIPFDTPCSATFLGTRVLVANQSAVQGDASHQAILSVEVGERGMRPHLPRSASFRP